MKDALLKELEALTQDLSKVESEADRIKSLIKLVNRTLKSYDSIAKGSPDPVEENNDNQDQRKTV